MLGFSKTLKDSKLTKNPIVCESSSLENGVMSGATGGLSSILTTFEPIGISTILAAGAIDKLKSAQYLNCDLNCHWLQTGFLIGSRIAISSCCI